MISRILLVLFLLGVFDQSLICMETLPQTEAAAFNFEKKIGSIEPGSPYDYDKGLDLIKRLLRLSKLPKNLSMKTLANLYAINDSTYNPLLKRLSGKVPSEKREELSEKVFKKRLLKGYLFDDNAAKVLIGDFLPRVSTTPHYQPKNLVAPLVLWNSSILEEDPEFLNKKGFQRGNKLKTEETLNEKAQKLGLEKEKFQDGKSGDEIGYNLYLPNLPGKKPKALFVHVYGGANAKSQTFLKEDFAFKPDPNSWLTRFLLSHNIAVVELNLIDLFENNKEQSQMNEDMFHRVLSGIQNFQEIIAKEPEILSDDPKMKESLKAIKDCKRFLYGRSFGAVTTTKFAQIANIFQEKFSGFIVAQGHIDGSENYTEHLRPNPEKLRTPFLVLHNFNDNCVPSKAAANFTGKLQKKQKKQTTVYMSKVGNLSLSSDKSNTINNIRYVGHRNPFGQNVQGLEEQILEFIDITLQQKSFSLSKRSKNWRQQRYELYGTLSDPNIFDNVKESKTLRAVLKKIFLAIARVTYEERRFKGENDKVKFKETFDSVYKPIIIEVLLRFKHYGKVFPWHSQSKVSPDDAGVFLDPGPDEEQKRLKEIGEEWDILSDLESSDSESSDSDSETFKIHKKKEKPFLTGLENQESFINAQIFKAFSDIGLPTLSFQRINEKEFLKKWSGTKVPINLFHEIFFKAKALERIKNISGGLKELVDSWRKTLKEEMEEWQNAPYGEDEDASEDKEKNLLGENELLKPYPIHQALMKMLSLNPKGMEWATNFKAFQTIIDKSRKINQKDDKGQTIWHLFVAESQRPEFYGTEQVKILKDLLLPKDMAPFHKQCLLSKDKDGNTPIHLAIEFEDTDLTQGLIQVTPSEVWEIQNRDGLTPLALAVYNLPDNHRDDVVQLLISAIQDLLKKEQNKILTIQSNDEIDTFKRIEESENKEWIQWAETLKEGK